ncbi:MAG: NFACT family protein [Candidatus Nanoarchaeia archaeon]
MNTTISSLELSFFVKELLVLEGGKIDKIFQQKESPDFLFTFHVPLKKKQHLFLSLPGQICLADFKPEFPQTPPSFCQSLRRKIQGAFITKIQQIGFERTIALHLSTKQGKGILYIELYSTGNIIYVDEQNSILSVFHQKIYNEKTKLLHKQKYTPQLSLPVIPTLSKEEFYRLQKNSSKDTLVTFLAVDCGLGGLFAQEVLVRSQFDQKKSLQDSSQQDIEKLFDVLQGLFDCYNPCIQNQTTALPFILESQADQTYEFVDTFSQALAKVVLQNVKKSQEKTRQQAKKSTSKIDTIIKKQEKQLRTITKSSQENQEKGELLYLHYQQIQLLLDTIAKKRKIQDWSALKKELLALDYVSTINEKQGTITINIPDRHSK